MTKLAVNGVDVHVVDLGVGRPILFVHGFPLDHAMWREQVAHFSRTRRVLAPDLRGFGKSGVTEGTVSMEQFADDLAALLDVLGVEEPVCFCGLSMGGYIAWQFFRRHRARLGALILCDTRAAADSAEGKQARQGMAKKVLASGAEFIAQTMPEKLFSRRTRAERPEIVAETQDVIRRTSPAGIAAAARGMAERPDATEWLGHIDVPTLMIVGAEDAISPQNEMQSMAAAIPGASLVVIPDAGHMAPLEVPSTVNAAIEEFLNQLR